MDGLNLSWHWSPLALAALAILCLLYLFGLWFAHRRVEQARLSPWRVLSFAASLLVMAFVLLSPLDVIGRTQLFSAHMVQLVLLTTLCVPLLLFAMPPSLLQPLLGLPLIRDVARFLTRPLLASSIFNLVFLLWHAPRLFNLAQGDPTIYHIQLLSITFAAVLNWFPLIGPLPELRPLSYPLQMLYAFLDGQPVDIFAFLLVFVGRAFYPNYAVPLQTGLNSLSDQMAGGAMLLIPGLVDLLVMSPLFFRWLRVMEERARLNDERLAALALEEEDDEEGEEHSQDIRTAEAGG
jgi:putative membrane protein